MKKATAALLAIPLLLLPLAGCGADEPFRETNAIHAVTRENGSGTRDAFVELFGILLRGGDGSRQDRTTPEADEVNKTGIVLTTVEGDPHAIGYLSIGSLNGTVKALAIDGVAATTSNVADGTYQIYRPFNIATKGEPVGPTADFIAFILSADGQAVVSAAGYIAVAEDAPAYQGSLSAGKIVVSGSSSVAPVMEKLQEAYLALNEDAEIELQMSDSSVGMTAVKEGACDIGMASRALKDSELEALTPTVIALDGLAVIVNRTNPIDGLTTDQVREIFLGGATVWGDVIR